MSITAASAVNYWPDTACARAFWGQQELPAYRELLTDTAAWLDPQPGERWLDLGCGSGQLTRALWEKGNGRLREIVGVDCAAVNQRAFDRLRRTVSPSPSTGQIRFVQLDLSAGLPTWDDEQIDGVVSGLAIQYAESYRADEGRWTTEAYDRLLEAIHRVLRPGGRFVFSVNVPEPAWGKVALMSLSGIVHARRPVRFLKNALRMWSYGGWLTREARRGRFHYLPQDDIFQRLTAVGFCRVQQRLSYAGQAYVFRCQKSV